MATHTPQESCGFSLYRGALVQWDEDHDIRILGVIDQMPTSVVDRLLVTQVHEGVISFVWDGGVPHEYEEGKSIAVIDHGYGLTSPPEEDLWMIHTSKGL